MNVEQGKFLWEGTVWIDEDTEVWTQEDVTKVVRKAMRERDDLANRVESLSKEIHDIKTRRYWEEVNVYTDDRTGRMVVVKTIFQYEPKTMRIESDLLWNGRL